mmetsp:Transcript_11563/g.13613  ORF Transcript_11563/g.13613 Transcript_11563/m.13613 type:complete len:83 (+) Transcript_11563:41-289(+)
MLLKCGQSSEIVEERIAPVDDESVHSETNESAAAAESEEIVLPLTNAGPLKPSPTTRKGTIRYESADSGAWISNYQCCGLFS